MQTDLWDTKLKLLNGDILIPEWECPTVLAENNTPTPTQTLIHKDVPANTERWCIGCDITVNLT